MIYGIRYLNKHSYHDMGITMPGEKEIGHPSKLKNIQRIPFSNVEYDFSFLYGEQTYSNRPLTYYFNIGIKNQGIEAMNREKTKIVNWLMHSKGKQPLYDDAYPGWHFLAEVEDDMSFTEDAINGLLAVTFTAYPFMIRNVNEGDDIWDTFDFENDVSQTLSATSKRGLFKPLTVGSYATVGAYATYYDGWNKISQERIGVSRKILSKEKTTQGTSNLAYELEGINGRILEQDLVETRVDPTKLTIINNGGVSVAPTITTNNKISIVKGNTVYNFFPGKITDPVFRLDVGVNELIISSIYDTKIEFEFYKEMI